MKRRIKAVVTAWVLVIVALVLNFYIGDVYAKRLKQIACEGVGCPNGSRACADLSGHIKTAVFEGGGTFYCYENAPSE